MRKVLSAAQMRDVDRRTIEEIGITSLVLMETAANAVVREISERLGGSIQGKQIVILCGKGNNGGDGLAVARILYLHGARCRVLLFFPPAELSPDASVNYKILLNLSGTKSQSGGIIELSYFFRNGTWDGLLDNADCIVDAIFGTGLTKPLSGRIASVVSSVREIAGRRPRPLLAAIDVPSGLSVGRVDSADEAFIADVTISFTAPKPENILAPFYRNNGDLIIADIGSPCDLIEGQSSALYLLEKSDATEWVRKSAFTADSYKNRRGHLALISGSAEYSGAAVLAATSAMRSGVGLVTLFVPVSIADSVGPRLPAEIILKTLPDDGTGAISEVAVDAFLQVANKFDAVGIGCGLGLNSGTKAFVRQMLAKLSLPAVIDADALNAFAPLTETEVINAKTAARIVTPHEGEFRRLAGGNVDLENRHDVVGDFASRNSLILVLKGERVLVGLPDGRVLVNPTGNSGLGKAGNGDTLTGLIGGFLAQAVALEIDIEQTIAAAVYFAGAAGDMAAELYGRRVMTATDVRECFTRAFRQIGDSDKLR